MNFFAWLAWRNLHRNVKRNLATGSAIAFGFSGILLLGGYTYRIKNYLRVYTVDVIHTGHVDIFAKQGFEKFAYRPDQYSLTPDDQKWITTYLKANPEVALFEGQIRGQGLVGNGCSSLPFVAQGFEPEVDRQLRESSEVKTWMPDFKFFLAGRGIWNFPTTLNPIALSKGLFLSLGKLHVHDEVENAKVTMVDCQAGDIKAQLQRDANVQLLSNAWPGGLSAVDGEIVGQFTTGLQESDASGLIADVGLLQKLYGTDHLTQVAVWLKNPQHVAAFTKRFQRDAERVGKSFELIQWDDEKISPYYAGTVQFLETMVVAVSIILAVIITLSVLNSTTMTILERSQEIGMYRSMGFRRTHIRLLYLLESLWLSLLSLLAGAFLGWASAEAINSGKIIYHPPGVAGGINLLLIIDWVEALQSAFLILSLVLVTTFFAVSSRLTVKPADLLGGTMR